VYGEEAVLEAVKVVCHLSQDSVAEVLVPVVPSQLLWYKEDSTKSSFHFGVIDEVGAAAAPPL
jgi:hypothetical protein